MVVQRTKRKIRELQEQPEEVRFRAVTRYTIIIAIAAGILWVSLLLPLQIILGRPRSGLESLLPIGTSRPASSANIASREAQATPALAVPSPIPSVAATPALTPSAVTNTSSLTPDTP